MLISNKLHSFRNFLLQIYCFFNYPPTFQRFSYSLFDFELI